MDFFVTCAFITTIIVNPHLNNISTVSSAALVKDCKVVLEDISSSRDVVKLKMLKTSQENTHTTNSHLTKEKRLLEGLSVKTPIA